MKTLCFVLLLLVGFSSCGKDEVVSNSPLQPGADSSMSDSDKKDDDELSKEDKDEEQAVRPSDLDLAMNAVVAWSVEPEVYLSKIDLEMLERQQSVTIEQLKGLVKIDAVVDHIGVYHFTDEDILHVKLVDVKWNRELQKITFRLAYKNMVGRLMQSLPFDLDAYYAARFKVNVSFVEAHYLQGVYQNAGAFLEDLLVYDVEEFLPELYSKGIDVRHNTMTVTFKLYHKKSKQDLGVQVTKELRGFKTQDELLKAVMIGATAEVHEQAVELMARYDFKKDLKDYLKNKILNKKWMQQMDYSIGNQPLYYSVERSDIYSRPVEIIKGQGSRLDVYLESPVWRLDEAELDGRHLKLRVGLYSINHIDLTGISYDIVIPNVIK